MADYTFDKVERDVIINDAGRDIINPKGDAVRGNKIINITEVHNYYGDEKNPKKASAIHIPRLMPYLPNRIDQELKLGDSIRAHRDLKRPLICIVHGEEEQCADMFMERIEHKCLYKIIPEQTRQGVKSYHFSCDTFNNSQELHRKMQVSLAEAVIGDMFADPANIAQTLAQQKTPILLCVTLSSEYCSGHKGTQTIDFFLQFWTNWTCTEQQQYLLLVCLCFDYKPVKAGFLNSLWRKDKLNTQLRNYLQALDFAKFRLNGVILPELSPIQQSQVEEWARIHLNSIHERLRPKIQRLFTENKQQAIAMQPLAQQLEKMLKEFA
jgi:hypothetical protein